MEKLDLYAIRNKIEEYNKQIELLLCPDHFTLNNAVVELSNKISKLQEKCPHDYLHGFCRWCYKSKE